MDFKFNLAGFHHRKKEGNTKKQRWLKKGNADSTSPRTAGIAKTKSLSSVGVPNVGPQFWEEEGLRIPLYKGGRKRICASVSASLRNKKVEELLEIVEDYAGANKRQQMDGGKQTKAYIADWIESKETLALGRNRHSKLPPNVQRARLRREDDVAPAPKPVTTVSLANTKKKTEVTSSKKQSLQVHTKQDTVRISKIQAESKQTIAVARPDETQDMHSNETIPKDQGHDFQASTLPIDSGILNESLSDVERSNKRKHGNTHEPTLLQQTAKKQRTHDSTGEVSEAKSTISKPDNTQYPLQDHTVHFQDPVAQRREQKEATLVNTINKMNEEASKLARRQAFMNDVGLDPTQLDRSTVIVPGKYKDTVLTVTSNAESGYTIIHDTQISHSCNKLNMEDASPVKHQEPSFLKPGRHGRHGDFDDDEDRFTGRGHQMTPEDEVEYHNYLQFRGDFLDMYPTYPRLAEGNNANSDLSNRWNDNEVWYRRFREKYSGLAPAHLWDCGCEKIGDGSESEAE
ncbi:hypothetical protein P153DRAFT_381838 [Dothidotthia symphoricarpi CBS 119687]|uniref:Uncharacterized protein n=1 Tax=Dothidotthia symphoricarpi CBS 119687 TaxID=1392245 RepID=A0A6A6AQG5_9PLEO|nr:uncharacterized protein P153DRAFT_381838 [Dothidotthia symphoricarpi CBS 119687]KAF2133408.1 hypothetical protein P153DRAFT_381838 [Dothidotthia symphoricarpi CBS 119687]